MQYQEQNFVTGTGSREPLPSQKTSLGLTPLATRCSMTALARASDNALSPSRASNRSLWPVMMTEPTASGRVSLPSPFVIESASLSSSFLPSSLSTALLNAKLLSPCTNELRVEGWFSGLPAGAPGFGAGGGFTLVPTISTDTRRLGW